MQQIEIENVGTEARETGLTSMRHPIPRYFVGFHFGEPGTHGRVGQKWHDQSVSGGARCRNPPKYQSNSSRAICLCAALLPQPLRDVILGPDAQNPDQPQGQSRCSVTSQCAAERSLQFDVPDSAIAPAGTDDKLTAAESALNWRRLRKCFLCLDLRARVDELYSSEMPSAKVGI